MTNILKNNTEYKAWLNNLKKKVYTLQVKAAVQVNQALLSFYWELGKEIFQNKQKNNWGDSVIEQLAKDLHSEFPQIKGFSRRNLFYIQKWYYFYNTEFEKVQQAVAQNIPELSKKISIEKIQQLVGQIPWGHNILIITKLTTIEEALFYAKKTIENGWSRAVLRIQIETDLFKRQGRAITNFQNYQVLKI